jgi:hypothetical protein
MLSLVFKQRKDRPVGNEFDELKPLAVVHKRLRDETAADGVQLRTFVLLVPDHPDGPFAVQGVWLLDEDWTPPGEDAAKDADPEFERVIREAEQAEAEEKATKAREGLSKLRDELKDPSKGIGLDG